MPSTQAVPVNRNCPDEGRRVMARSRVVSPGSPPPSATIARPTRDCSTPSERAPKGWPSNTTKAPAGPLPPLATTGAWLTGVIGTVTTAVSDRASAVAPSLMLSSNRSSVFCTSVPPAVCS